MSNVLNQNEYIDKIENLARNEWFADHKAELIENGDYVRMIRWQEPGTREYKMSYVFVNGAIFITGDMGDAVYNWHNYNHLKAFKGFGMPYFTTKLTAFENEKYKFDPEYAEVELKRYWEEYKVDEEIEEEEEQRKKELEEEYEAILNCITQSSTIEEYHGFVRQAYDDCLINGDGDDIEYIWDFGKRIHARIIGYWVGLQMALDQLIEKGEI